MTLSRSPLYEAAKAVVEHGSQCEGGSPLANAIDDLARILHDIDQALATLDEYRVLMRGGGDGW